MEFKKPKIDKKLIYYMSSNVISKVIMGVAGIFLARYLSKVDYGILTTATAFVGFIFIFVNFGMWDYCLIELSKIKNNVESILGKILIIFIILYLIGSFITYILYNQIYDVGIIIAILLYFKLFFDWILNGIIVVLQSKDLFNKISVIQIITSLVMVVPVTLLYIFSFGLNEYVFTSVILTAIFVICLVIGFGSKLINISTLLRDIKFNKSILYNSYYFFVSGLMAYIYMQSDILMLSFMAGPIEVSRYAVVTVLIFAAYLIPTSIYNYYLPKIAGAYASNSKDDLNKIYRQFKILTIGIMFLISIFLFIFSKNILNMIYGVKYLDSSNILKILSVVLFFHSFCSLYGAVITASGNQKLRSKLQILAAFFNIILNIYFIPLYGAEGAAITTAMTEIVIFLGYYFCSKKLLYIA
jgi:O-antigen/teichoic acid export membrane protein